MRTVNKCIFRESFLGLVISLLMISRRLDPVGCGKKEEDLLGYISADIEHFRKVLVLRSNQSDGFFCTTVLFIINPRF